MKQTAGADTVVLFCLRCGSRRYSDCLIRSRETRIPVQMCQDCGFPFNKFTQGGGYFNDSARAHTLLQSGKTILTSCHLHKAQLNTTLEPFC